MLCCGITGVRGLARPAPHQLLSTALGAENAWENGVLQTAGLFSFFKLLKKKPNNPKQMQEWFWELCKKLMSVRGASAGCSRVRQGLAVWWGWVSQLPAKFPPPKVFPMQPHSAPVTLRICPSTGTCLSSFLVRGWCTGPWVTRQLFCKTLPTFGPMSQPCSCCCSSYGSRRRRTVLMPSGCTHTQVLQGGGGGPGLGSFTKPRLSPTGSLAGHQHLPLHVLLSVLQLGRAVLLHQDHPQGKVLP